MHFGRFNLHNLCFHYVDERLKVRLNYNHRILQQQLIFHITEYITYSNTCMLHLLEHGQHPIRSYPSWKRRWWRNGYWRSLWVSVSRKDRLRIRPSVENVAAIHESTNVFHISVSTNQFNDQLAKTNQSSYTKFQRKLPFDKWKQGRDQT